MKIRCLLDFLLIEKGNWPYQEAEGRGIIMEGNSMRKSRGRSWLPGNFCLI
jgi:hypothetical protein